ncbi:MAG TPA: bacillithiol system redox-active protein YtxJ [Pyrinomonadaceae bacterium]|jgi:bacillithiol system protein YtxJ
MNARFKEIYDSNELEDLFQKSFDTPVLLFKHSLTCPISASAYHEISNADADVNIIVVQHAREVSNAIAEKTGIRHESPQAIVLKDGEVIYHASHYNITPNEVEKNLEAGN